MITDESLIVAQVAQHHSAELQDPVITVRFYEN